MQAPRGAARHRAADAERQTGLLLASTSAQADGLPALAANALLVLGMWALWAAYVVGRNGALTFREASDAMNEGAGAWARAARPLLVRVGVGLGVASLVVFGGLWGLYRVGVLGG